MGDTIFSMALYVQNIIAIVPSTTTAHRYPLLLRGRRSPKMPSMKAKGKMKHMEVMVKAPRRFTTSARNGTAMASMPAMITRAARGRFEQCVSEGVRESA